MPCDQRFYILAVDDFLQFLNFILTLIEHQCDTEQNAYFSKTETIKHMLYRSTNKMNRKRNETHITEKLFYLREAGATFA